MRVPAPPPRAIADAVFVGWLPLIAVNALFVQRIAVQLSPRQRALHHLYDAGQVLGLAVASWVVVRLLWQLPLAKRAVAGAGLATLGTYALLAGDLESFLERQGSTAVPWHPLFALAAALAIVGGLALGALLSQSVLRWVGIAAGSLLAVGNHFVLELNYPGTHFVLAWLAAWLIGASALPWVVRSGAQPVLRPGLMAALLLALPSYAVVPRPVVRGALLGSSGAVAAPFVTRLWAGIRGEGVPRIPKHQQAWFEPRASLPAVPAAKLPGAPAAPIVILLTVDALRNDAIEGRRAKGKHSTNLRAMAKESLTFAHAWAAAPYTMGSLRTLFLGTYYLQHPGGGTEELRKRAGQRVKVPDRPYFPELLARRGVTTVNLRTVKILGRNGTICRGFGEEIAIAERARSPVVVEALLKRLDEHRGGPLFLYSHMYDPHSPYDRGEKRGSEKQRYLSEVGLVDAAIGTLRSELRERGLDQAVYLFVTADHGEAFGEHGHYHHGTTVYEEMVRVPLLIEGPAVVARRSKRAVSLVDLGPTILALFGVETPGYAMGQSLVPLMRGEDPVLSRPLVIDGGRAIRAMLFDRRIKAIVDVNRGTEELYDLEQDPEERRNLAEESGASVYFATLRAFFAGLNPKAK